MLPVLSDLHHAYIIYGKHSEARSMIHTWLTKQDKEVELIIATYDTLAIGDVRTLKKSVYNKNNEHPHILMLMCNNIGFESEHALLKILEEPSEGTHICITVPPHITFLPTILSRTHEIYLDNHTYHQDEYTLESFIKDPAHARIDKFKKLFSATQNKTPMTSDHMYALCAQYENYIHDKNLPKKNLDYLYTAMKYLLQKGSSPKIIAEYLSIMIPTESQ